MIGWILVFVGCVFIARAAFGAGKDESARIARENQAFEEKVMNIVNKNK